MQVSLSSGCKIWAVEVVWELNQGAGPVNWGLLTCLFSLYEGKDLSAGLKWVWDKEKTEELFIDPVSLAWGMELGVSVNS